VESSIPIGSKSQPEASISINKELIQLLNQVVDRQIEQDRAMVNLKAQNSELLNILAAITENSSGQYDGLAHVKIENANMPFWAMVGLILKFTFASLPAIIVFFVLSLIIMAVLAAIGLIPLLLGLSQISY
jgi:type III secretory pathway component EscU